MNVSKLDYILNTSVQTFDEMLANEILEGKREKVAKHIICADGTTISVQASSTHYCTPREDQTPWSAVECGYPSVIPPDTWMEYAEEWDSPTGTVYGYVPVELVREFIADHGGEAE
jgi:hypothetical protein